MSNYRYQVCPRCQGTAKAEQGHQLAHGGGHGVLHGLKHPNPVLMGIGVLMMGAQYIKNRWFKCQDCGHRFLGL